MASWSGSTLAGEEPGGTGTGSCRLPPGRRKLNQFQSKQDIASENIELPGQRLGEVSEPCRAVVRRSLQLEKNWRLATLSPDSRAGGAATDSQRVAIIEDGFTRSKSGQILASRCNEADRELLSITY